MVQLLNLPSEVLELICSASTNALKELRLTSSRLSQASTPHLFRNLTLVPHAASFANLLALSQSPLLARHVHEIVYDVRMLSSIRDIKMAFEANEFTLVGRNIDASRRKVFALLDDYEKKAFNSVEMTEVEIEHLLTVLPSLPNLKHLTVTSGSLHKLPYFYSKLKSSLSITSDYYFETDNRSGHHARSMLLCLSALNMRIPRLSFLGIDWKELVLFSELRTPARYLTMLQRVFRRLPRDILPLPMFLFLYTSNDNDHGAALDDLLPVLATVLDNVQHLNLSMATARSERQLFMPTGPSYPLSAGTDCASLSWVLECMMSIGQVGPGHLKSLTLASLVLKKEDLEFCLDGCRETLTEISIGDVRLYTPNQNLANASGGVLEESCLVDLLEVIPKRTRELKRVRLFGRFYNGASQNWTVNPRDMGNLRANVEHWIVNGGKCPLNSERITGRLQGTRAGDPSFKTSQNSGTDDESEDEFLGGPDWA